MFSTAVFMNVLALFLYANAENNNNSLGEEGDKRKYIEEIRLRGTKETEIVEDIHDVPFGEDEALWGRLMQSSFDKPQCTIALDPVIKCSLVSDPNTSCNDYVNTIDYIVDSQCIAEVLYEYKITNNGSYDDIIKALKTSVDDERPFQYIGNTMTWKERNLVPGGSITFIQQRRLNFCSHFSTALKFEVGVYCPNGQIFHQSFINFTAKQSVCDCTVDISCETKEGGECTLPTQRSSTNICSFRPFYFDFIFVPRNCAADENNRVKTMHKCEDFEDMTSVNDAFVIVEGKKKNTAYFYDTVEENEVFTIGKGSPVESDMTVTVFNQKGGRILQRFSFHSSCSKDLFLDDTFGSITIAGFRDDKNNIVSSSISDRSHPEFKFTYNINNGASNSVALRKIVFEIDSEKNNFHLSGRQVQPYGTLTGSQAIEIVSTQSPCSNVTVALEYRTLPAISSQICMAKAVYYPYGLSSISDKAKKGSKKSIGKGSHATMSRGCILDEGKSKQTRKVSKSKSKSKQNKR